MEDVVRALASAGRANQELVEVLFTGERVLESMIDARRKGEPVPSADAYVEQVRNAIAAAKTESSAHSVALHRPTTASCRFVFVPSANLAARGVGVEMIRQRLGTLGDIVVDHPARAARPEEVTFEFAVSVKNGERPPDELWREDGLAWDVGITRSIRRRSPSVSVRVEATAGATPPGRSARTSCVSTSRVSTT